MYTSKEGQVGAFSSSALFGVQMQYLELLSEAHLICATSLQAECQ